MSSPQEDKPNASDTMETPTPAGPPTIVSVSGPLVPPGEADWAGDGLMVRYAGRTAVGLVREHNEDNFVIANLTTGEPGAREASLIDLVGEGGLLFAVCDGMGGAAAGEVASQMAVDVLQEAMRRGGTPRERDVLARRLVAAVEEAGRRIFDSAQKERSRRGMGTTATAAVLVDKVLFLAEVGDSRAYLLRGGELKQLTKDQSLVNQLIEAGHLTEAEAEAFEHSNIILQALGTSETVQVDLTFVELRRGDRVMLCSDGLSGLVGIDTLREALACIDDPAECTAALIRFAEESGGHDNITVVVIDFEGAALAFPSETDSFGYLQYPLGPAPNGANGTGEGEFSEEEVTEAATPTGRASYDSVPSYELGSGPSAAVDGNPWLWVSAGLTALLVGAWLLAASGGAGNALTERSAAPHATDAPAEAEPSLEKSDELARSTRDGKVVPVRVFSDVADDEAVLLVNGESRGKLPSGQDGRAIELAPGAYRFEAQSHGNIAAVEVVTVQQDSPLDIYLKVPSAANDSDQPSAPNDLAPEQVVADEPGANPTAAREGQNGQVAKDGPARAAPEAAVRDGKAQGPAAQVQGAQPRADDVAGAHDKPTPAAPAKATPEADAKHGNGADAHAAATPEAAAPAATSTPAAKPAPAAAKPAAATSKAPAATPEAKRSGAVATSAPSKAHRHKPATAEPSGAAHPDAATPAAAAKPAEKPTIGPLPDNPF